MGAMKSLISPWSSNTRPFPASTVTTVAVLQLYEAGRFLLTDPVSRYLPEFASSRIYLGQDHDGVVQTRPAVKPITIEDLLPHTAGLTYGDPTTTGVPLLYSAAEIWSVESLARFSENVAALPLMFEPGSRWHYSVANDILGRLVEVVSGQSFDRIVQSRHQDQFLLPAS